MLFTPPLQSATLIKRYKRFLADVITPEGQALTLHCPEYRRHDRLRRREIPSGIPLPIILNVNMRIPGN